MFNIQWSGAIFTVGCCTSLGISLRHFKLEMLKMHIDLFKNILLLMHIYKCLANILINILITSSMLNAVLIQMGVIRRTFYFVKNNETF